MVCVVLGCTSKPCDDPVVAVFDVVMNAPVVFVVVPLDPPAPPVAVPVALLVVEVAPPEPLVVRE